MSEQEKIELERQLKPLRDSIAEKKEMALMTLSDDDREALTQLQKMYWRREKSEEKKLKINSKAIASQPEALISTSKKPLASKALINEEKERLEKINEGNPRNRRKDRFSAIEDVDAAVD